MIEREKLYYGTKHVEIMPLPEIHQLSCKARAALDDYDLKAVGLPRSGHWKLRDRISKKECVVLRHDLSEHMKSIERRTTARAGGSRLEITAISRLDSFHDCLEQGEDGWLGALLLLLSRIVGGPGEFRAGSVGTVTDASGNRVIYPPAGDARTRIYELEGFLQAAYRHSPAFAGMVTMNAIFNAHPFMDGNGRVGRILFNWIAHPRNNGLYLPLYELAALSEGGFTIRIRQAQYRGEWEPLCIYLNKAIDIAIRRGSSF